MTIEQLQLFCAVTEHATFLEAAENRFISQSALSKQLKKLEEELEVSLIDRSRRSASLTEAGGIFAQDARLILMQYQIALSHLAPYRKDRVFRIGALPILGQYGLDEKLARFAADHSDKEMIIEDVEEKEMTAGFAEGRFDAVICRELSSAFPAAKFAQIAADELVAVVRDGHPLAKNAAVSVGDLEGEDLLLMNSYTSVYQLCMHILEQNGIKPSGIRSARLETVLSRAQVGQGIALLPYRNFRLFRHKNLTALPLRPIVLLPVLMVVRNGMEKGFGGELMEYLGSKD